MQKLFKCELGVVASGKSSLVVPVEAGPLVAATVLAVAKDRSLPADDVPVVVSRFPHSTDVALPVPAHAAAVDLSAAAQIPPT